MRRETLTLASWRLALQDLEDWGAREEDVIQEAARFGISKGDVKGILEKLLSEKRIYMPKGGYYKMEEA